MVVSSLLEPEWKESSHSIIHQIYRFEFCPSLFWSGLDIVDEREYKWAVFNIQMRGRAKLVALKWRSDLYNIIVMLMKCKSFNNQFFQSFVENNVIVLAPIYLCSSRFNVHCLFMPYLTIIWLYKIQFPYLVCRAVFVIFQTFRFGNGSDQVHYQSQEREGGRQQRVGVEKLNCQIQSRIPENIQNKIE